MYGLLRLNHVEAFNIVPETISLRYDMYHSSKDVFNKMLKSYLDEYHAELTPQIDTNIPLLSVHTVVGTSGVDADPLSYLYITYWGGEEYVSDLLAVPEITLGMLLALSTFEDKSKVEFFVKGIVGCVEMVLNKVSPRPNEDVFRLWSTDDEFNVLRRILAMYLDDQVPSWDPEIYRQLHKDLGYKLVNDLFPYTSFLGMRTDQNKHYIDKVLDALQDKPVKWVSVTPTRKASADITIDACTMPIDVWNKIAPITIGAKLRNGAPLTKQETNYLTAMLNERWLMETVTSRNDSNSEGSLHVGTPMTDAEVFELINKQG